VKSLASRLALTGTRGLPSRRSYDLNQTALANQRNLVEQHLHKLFYKERVAPRLRDDHALERRHLDPIAEQRREYFRGRLFAQRIEGQLGIVTFAIPLM